jgi:H+-transporting ATPase
VGSSVEARRAKDVLLALGSDSKTGLTSAVAAARSSSEGPNDVPERPDHPVRRFASKFWGLSAWMLELIVVLSGVLHKWTDLCVALALVVVNAILGFFQEQHASAAIAALRRRLQVVARVLRDGSWQPIPARDLVRGDVVRIRTGDFVPADLELLEGSVEVDQSALTGESRELSKTADDEVFSSAVVRSGEATGVVTAIGLGTYFGRTMRLVESAHPKLHVEQVVTHVVKWLLLIVGVLVAVALMGSLAAGSRLVDVLPLSLVLLMSAVPVALPVMFTVSMAVGSVELARRGVLVTRLGATEDAANMDVLCADKTGTLTLNELELAGVVAQPGFDADDVVQDGALASQEADQDPIDLAFLRAAHSRQLLDDRVKRIRFEPFSPANRRTEAVVELPTGPRRVIKGALRTVAEAVGLDSSAIAALESRANEEARSGRRVIAVARSDRSGLLRLVGVALLRDPIRPDSRRLVDELRSLGVSVKMVTGDALPVAREVAHALGMDSISPASELRDARKEAPARAIDLVRAADGFAEVFPEDKIVVVQSLQSSGHVVGMTGDGVNDAPALRQAEVGIAVCAATDVAKAAASVVLTTDGLENIVDLVTTGRAVYQRVLTWIVNKVSRTILKSAYVVIAFLATGQFVISALGMVLLVFMTDFVKIALATDRVRASRRPDSWNIGPLVSIAVVLGLLMLMEALGLLAIGWHAFDLGNRDGKLGTFAFQTLLFFALLSILSIRERRGFWSSRPSAILAVALALDALAGIAIGAFGLAELRPLSAVQTLLVVGYATACCLLVNDPVKVLLVGRISRSDRA